jgi:hypothetical protein
MMPIRRPSSATGTKIGQYPSPPPVLGAIGVPGTNVAVGPWCGFLVAVEVGDGPGPVVDVLVGVGVLVTGVSVTVGVTGVSVGGVLVGEPPTQ